MESMEFTKWVFRRLEKEGLIRPTDSILAVCAHENDRKLFLSLGYPNVTISNIDERLGSDAFAPYAYAYQNAQKLKLPDGSFDMVYVSRGLHHCACPHQAVVEMYRVARKGIVAIEARDSLLMRLSARLKTTASYEVGTVLDHQTRYGGVNNSPIPNYVYRWTEREFTKTIDTYDPTGKHRFLYFHNLALSWVAGAASRNPLKRAAVWVAKPLVGALTTVLKSQCNELAMVAIKPRIPQDLWPWLRLQDGVVVFDDQGARKWVSRVGG